MKTITAMLLLCLVGQGTLAQTTNPWEKKLQAAKTDTAKLRICINAGEWFTLKRSKYDSADFFLQKGLIINNKIGTNKLSPSLFLSLGILASSNKDLDKAEFYYKQCQQISLQQHDPIKHQKATFNLIFITRKRGFLPSAIKQFLAFDRTISNKTPQDSVIKRALYSNLSLCYEDLDDKQKYHFYIKKQLAYCQTPKDSLSIYQKVFIWSIKYTNSLDSNAYANIIRLSEKLNLPGSKIVLTVNLSDYYIRQKEYDKAIEMAQAAIKMAGNKPEWEVYKMFGYENIGEAYSGKKQYAEALQYFAKTTDYIKKDVKLRYLSYAHLVKVYEGLGDYKKAYEYSSKIAEHEEEVKGNRNKQIIAEIDAEMAAFEAQKIAIEKQTQLTESELKAQLQEERLKTEQQERIALELRSELELSTKEKEINLQKNEITTHKTLNQLKEERIKAEQQQKNIVITLLLLSLGLLAWAVWSYRKQRQLSKILDANNKLISQQATDLKDSNLMKDKIFALLSHDLRTPINRLILALNSTLENQKIALMHELHNVQDVLNNVLYWSSMQVKKNTPQKREIHLKPLVDTILNDFDFMLHEKQIEAINAIEPRTILFSDENYLKIILRNLISNAVKFTQPHGFIHVSYKTNDNTAAICVRDTGVGIATEKMGQLFHYPDSSLGTKQEVGSGLGLSLCYEIAKLLKGDLIIDSQIEQGTKVTIELPIREITNEHTLLV